MVYSVHHRLLLTPHIHLLNMSHSNKSQTVVSKGIFHGLPTFPHADGNKYSAIVTGANGITGAHVVRVLAENPERWETVYALSRKRPATPSTASNVKHIELDFLAPAEVVAEQLKALTGKV
jgi:hypothetical protein